MLLYFATLSISSQYAILFAGSKEFYNYRHQADVFTIYGQLLSRGFTTKNIALYAYDDIVNDPENIYQGQIFHSIDHKTNVYPGTNAINFSGDKVTANSFYDSILSLPTTADDYVFIFYNNHGGAGFLAAPDESLIQSKKLSEVFESASENKLFKKCLFLIEACYAGSVGESLNAPNLATITASNSKEPSNAAIFDEELGCWLTNEFTSNFINLIDENPKLLVGELYDKLYELTTESHSIYYGDEEIKKVQLSKFIGEPQKIVNNIRTFSERKRTVTQKKAADKTLDFLSKHPKSAVRARAKIHILKRKAQTEKLQTALDYIVKFVDPKNYDKIMNDTEAKITDNYFDILNLFVKKFGQLNPDDYGRFSVLKALAASHSKEEIIKGIDAILK